MSAPAAMHRLMQHPRRPLPIFALERCGASTKPRAPFEITKIMANCVLTIGQISFFCALQLGTQLSFRLFRLLTRIEFDARASGQ